MDDQDARKARKEKLLQFYRSQGGLSAVNDQIEINNDYLDAIKSSDPCDIDGAAFQPSDYLTKLLKEKNLPELMEKEKEMIEKIRSLDSEMQTLVYDNYNKFITATDTIKMMKTDFKKMEEEMNLLAQNMKEINRFSVEIRDALEPKRGEINKLAGTHHLLRKLQYLFELPQRLRICVSNEQYSQAVRYYNKAKTVLDRYKDMPSFQGIRNDCQNIITELNGLLWKQFSEATEVDQLVTTIDILRQLAEPVEILAKEFIKHSKLILEESFGKLRKELNPPSVIETGSSIDQALNPYPPDILHFANIATELVLDKFSNHVALYNELFLSYFGESSNEEAKDDLLQDILVGYLDEVLPQFFNIINERMLLEKESGDNAMFVRAMDRFHARLQALNKLVPRADISPRSLQMVCNLGHDRCLHYLSNLKRHFTDCLTDVRQRLASGAGGFGLSGRSQTSITTTALNDVLAKENSPAGLLTELWTGVSTALIDQMKATLNAQQSFIAMDNSFSKKPMFHETFCVKDVREGIVVGFLQHMVSISRQLAEEHQMSGISSSASLLIILSKLFFDWGNSGTIEYLLTLADEQFLIGSFENDKSMLTPATSLNDKFRDCGHLLLNAFVRVQGLSLSQMIRKSVETRDWLSSIEPRSVRSVMKRVVEDVAQIDTQVSQLFDSQSRATRDRSSDSSRRGLLGGGHVSAGQASTSKYSLTPSNLNPTLITNIQKLFAEKIDIFSNVEPYRDSILTGVIKISLKTFIECVRMRTFGKFGLQQVQVDCHYLQIYLWRFVADEKLVNFLLDEIIGSVMQRCVEPVVMEDSIIEAICES